MMKESHTPAPDKQVHYAWVFDPQQGTVQLSDDHKRERRHRGHHTELADAVNRHPNRVHGYAYRLHNGWRITDWEHKPVDKFIVHRVLDAIRKEEL